jgi:hypothetical protein
MAREKWEPRLNEGKRPYYSSDSSQSSCFGSWCSFSVGVFGRDRCARLLRNISLRKNRRQTGRRSSRSPSALSGGAVCTCPVEDKLMPGRSEALRDFQGCRSKRLFEIIDLTASTAAEVVVARLCRQFVADWISRYLDGPEPAIREHNLDVAIDGGEPQHRLGVPCGPKHLL